MFADFTSYQIVVILLLGGIVVSNILIAIVVTSKYYHARFVSKEEQENLEINAKIRKFVGTLILSDPDIDIKAKVNQYLKNKE